MPWQPTTISWPGEHAVLFIHGVGNAAPNDYDPLVQEFTTAIGPANAAKTAIYFLYYDEINDWMNRKTRFSNLFQAILNQFNDKSPAGIDTHLSKRAAEIVGDVVFPVLDRAAREMVQSRFIAQLHQMREDGSQSQVQVFDQRISIVCHSLGCFHTYEVLHRLVNDTDVKLQPSADAMQFRNVIFMASPVNLIRSVADKLGGLVAGGLATTDAAGLSWPADKTTSKPAVQKVVAITGDMDPVGGHLFGKKIDWGYMKIDGQDTIVDDQSILGHVTQADLVGALNAALGDGAGPNLPLNNPHSWSGYVNRHAGELSTWFDVT